MRIYRVVQPGTTLGRGDAEAFVIDLAADTGSVDVAAALLIERSQLVAPPPIFVLLDMPDADDLVTLVAARLDGIVLTGTGGPVDVEQLGARLAVAEALAGVPDGSVEIVALADTARAVVALAAFASRRPARLAGLAVDCERLAAELGCATDAPVLAHARAATLLAAAACGVPAILACATRTDGPVADREGFHAILIGRAARPVRPSSGARC